MSASDTVEVLDAIRSAGCRFWLEGGWGVDALVGRQTRSLRDVDVHDSVPQVRSVRLRKLCGAKMQAAAIDLSHDSWFSQQVEAPPRRARQPACSPPQRTSPTRLRTPGPTVRGRAGQRLGRLLTPAPTPNAPRWSRRSPNAHIRGVRRHPDRPSSAAPVDGQDRHQHRPSLGRVSSPSSPATSTSSSAN
jgi:hypothetical protein